MLVRRSMAALTFVVSVQAQYLATVVAGGGGLTAAANKMPATSVPLGPTGLAVDSAGNVYVANGGPSVRLKISSGGILAIAAGTPNALGMTGNGGPAASAELDDPSGVAIDIHGNLYIADAGNNLIRKVGVDGTISTIAGATDLIQSIHSKPPGGQLNCPSGGCRRAARRGPLLRPGSRPSRLLRSKSTRTGWRGGSNDAGPLVLHRPLEQ